MAAKQVEVGPNPGGDGQRRALLLMEEQLRNRLGEHLSTLLRVCPELQEADLVRGQPPTTQKLYLPSDFIDTDRSKYKLEKIAEKEAQIQIAEAHDALRRLRNSLGLKALLLQSQKKHVRGYEQITKARGSVVIAERGIKRQAEAYKRAWNSICLLDVAVGPDKPAGDLRPLLDRDIVPLRDFSDDRRYVGDNEGIPWIWRLVSVNRTDCEAEEGVIGTVNSWNNEGVCVSPDWIVAQCLYNPVVRLAWLHAQASRDRWWEEVTLLKEELRRVGASFTHRQLEWLGIADAAHVDKSSETRVTCGARAYAFRQAAVYGYLAADAHRRYEDATKPYKPKPFGTPLEGSANHE